MLPHNSGHWNPSDSSRDEDDQAARDNAQRLAESSISQRNPSRYSREEYYQAIRANPQHPTGVSSQFALYQGLPHGSMSAPSHQLASNYSAGWPQGPPLNTSTIPPNYSSFPANTTMWPGQSHLMIAPNSLRHHASMHPHSLGYPATLHHSYPDHHGGNSTSLPTPWDPSTGMPNQTQGLAHHASSADVYPDYVNSQDDHNVSGYNLPPQWYNSPHAVPIGTTYATSHGMTQSPPLTPLPMGSGAHDVTQEIYEICRWAGCSQTIRVTGSCTDLLRALKSHFDRTHSGSDSCGWEGCVCKRVARDLCSGRPATHSAHVQKMWVHIYRVHLHHISSQKGVDRAEFPGSPSSSAAGLQ